MARKLIKLGNSTLVVSLPSVWTAKYGLKAGDEVEVQEIGKVLNLSTLKSVSFEKKTLDLSDLDEKIIRNYLNALYIKGFDEIELNFSNPAVLNIIQENSAFLIGFEVVKQGNNYCVLKDISGTAAQESLEDSLSRLYSLVVSIALDTLDAVKKRDLKALQNIAERDFIINKFAYFCLRILSKKGYKDFRNTQALYSFILNLESLADQYNRICRTPTTYKSRLSQSLLAIFEECTEMVKLSHSLFQKFDAKKSARLYELREKVRNYYHNLKPKNAAEANATFYLRAISNSVIDLLKLQIILDA